MDKEGKKHMKIRSFAFLLSLVVVMTFLSPYNFIVRAEGIIVEETIDDTVMVQSDYADNRVLVVLDNETSLQFNEYDIFFFPGLDCKSITNLTPSFTTIAKAQIENKTMSNIQSNIEINNFEQILCIELNSTGKDNVARAIKLLESIDGVKSASPDYILSKFSTIPNDIYTEEWPLDNIQLTQAWDIATGSASIKVGVIDSGIDGTHPDLSSNINFNLCRDFTSGSTLPTPSPTDTDGHGTAVAGIIGAKGNNGIGISGICWDVQLVALKITTDYTDSYTSHVVSAIDYAQSQNIPILNLSLGGYMPNTTEIPDPSMYSALSNYTGLAVCSAGNHGQNIDNQITVWPQDMICLILLVWDVAI